MRGVIRADDAASGPATPAGRPTSARWQSTGNPSPIHRLMSEIGQAGKPSAFRPAFTEAAISRSVFSSGAVQVEDNPADAHEIPFTPPSKTGLYSEKNAVGDSGISRRSRSGCRPEPGPVRPNRLPSGDRGLRMGQLTESGLKWVRRKVSGGAAGGLVGAFTRSTFIPSHVHTSRRSYAALAGVDRRRWPGCGPSAWRGTGTCLLGRSAPWD